MQNLKPLAASELLTQTKDLVDRERRVTLELIEYLREIDRRYLFAEMGYGSLFEFCTKELGLSEGSAQRRIQAMRLIRDVPSAWDAIESGRVTLSNAAKVQTFFAMEKKQGKTPNKLAVLAQVEGTSQRECEQRLFKISPQSVPRERERVVSSQEREIRLIMSEELYQKLQKLRAALAHAHPEASYAQLIEHATDAALEKLAKKRGPVLDSTTLNHTTAVRTEAVPSESRASKAELDPARALPSGIRVPLPAALKREVWHIAMHRCQFVSRQGVVCNSNYRLEIDHRAPLANGGANHIDNLQILCWTHHRHKSVGNRIIK